MLRILKEKVVGFEGEILGSKKFFQNLIFFYFIAFILFYCFFKNEVAYFH